MPAGADGGADEDSSGRGQAECAGAGDDQHAGCQVRRQQQPARARRHRRARLPRHHLPARHIPLNWLLLMLCEAM